MLANPCKISGLSKPGGFRKTLADRIRLRCVLRSGPRHLLEAGVCGRGGGGGSRWPDRIWSSYGRENRTAACACAWKADKCVSYSKNWSRDAKGEIQDVNLKDLPHTRSRHRSRPEVVPRSWRGLARTRRSNGHRPHSSLGNFPSRGRRDKRAC